jgi:hypothetical protein
MTDAPVPPAFSVLQPPACTPWAALSAQAREAEAAGQLRRAEVKRLEALALAFEHPGAEPEALVRCTLDLATFHHRHGPPASADRFARQAVAFAAGAGLADLLAEAQALLARLPAPTPEVT